jgi:hypothetical protein
MGGFVHPIISISKIHPFSLQFPKWVVLSIQTSPSPKFIHFPCSFQNGWVYPSKHLHLQNSSIYPAVTKMGGFIRPNISISKIHPFSLQFPKWVGLSIQTSPSPKFIHLPCN